jgi:hypothetical protein
MWGMHMDEKVDPYGIKDHINIVYLILVWKKELK